MEIYSCTEMPEDNKKAYYGFKLILSKTYKWRFRSPITKLYYQDESFYIEENSRFCNKCSLCLTYYRSMISNYPRIFDNYEEAVNAWNATIQNYLDKYQSEFEKNYNNIKKYKI